MSFFNVSRLSGFVFGNTASIVEDAIPVVTSVVSAAAGTLSSLPYLQIGGAGLLVGAGYLSYRYFDERGVQARASLLMRDNMGGYEKAVILRAIQEIPSGERDDVMNRALPLMRDNMNGVEKAFILDAIRGIPSGERADVQARALLLMRDNMGGVAKLFILDAIRGIPSGERDDVMNRALPLMRDNMNGYEKADILRAIRGIPSGERDDVQARALLLMRDNMDGYEKADILRAIQEIPSGERDDVMNRALPLMRDNMSGEEKVEILQRIRRIPLAERAPRAERAREQIQIDFPDGEVVDLNLYLNRIRHLLETPLNQPFLPMGQDDGMAAAAAAGHIEINVHAGSRDGRVKAALLLLRKSQEEMTDQEIDSAANACITYLQENGHQRALRVLNGPNSPNDFGPFFNQIVINGELTSGQEVMGRLWLFIHGLPHSEKSNAIHSLVAELEKCVNENGERICNPGKMQHLFIAVLQGRLEGVQVDDSIEIPKIKQEESSSSASSQEVPVETAIRLFFENPKHQEIGNFKELLEVARAFCQENPHVNPEAFIEEIKAYAESQGIDSDGKEEE